MKKKRVKKVCSMGLLATLLFGTAAGAAAPSVQAEEEKPEIKNVIMLIGDGMGATYTTAHRYMKDNPDTQEMEKTVFDKYLVGMQSTYSADPYYDGGEDDVKENVPDSAATATAMSSGVKTYNGAIAKDLEEEDTKTVLEAAKGKGMATGLVSTSEVNHATPASYGTHDVSRQNYQEIADDYYDDLIDGEHKVDVLLGGGTDFFEGEDRNLAELFEKDGYNYVKTTDELLSNTNDQLLGLFAPVGMDKYIDRPEEQPSLKQMTTSALDVLQKDEEGFFLMVEGSQIDWAGHDNDVVAAMSEMEDFERAFEAAIEFAKQDEHTLVVATADHSTGGLSIGADGEYNWNTDVIKAAKKTPDYMANQIVVEGQDIESTLNDNIDFEIEAEELQSVTEAYEEGQADGTEEEDLVLAVDDAIESIFDQRSLTGWTTDGHTGDDVPVYAYGPGSEMFAGMIDNTDQAKNIFKILGVSQGEDGGELADTSTSYPVGLLIGGLLLGTGAVFLFRKKKVTA
ncbi:alkaline phosphatase [Halobacillus sp. Marseille-Q1614]|uniref:alkaline phosphatase n=1 Tax=Halobacillus sp. Marseille-Q1614 TaxID=2709134 RepID=UPI00156DE6F7|nr:alkaline phosphatase [Halobacillus sp. Marseille-Q1614]